MECGFILRNEMKVFDIEKKGREDLELLEGQGL